MSLIDEYISHGWRLVPILGGSKRPRHTGWEAPAGALAHASDLIPGDGVGLMHSYSGTMALDIDDWDRTKIRLAEIGVDLEALWLAPDAVQILSGVPGHGKLLYKMPFGIPQPMLKVQHEVGRDALGRIKRAVTLELRCASMEGTTVQDVLPPSIHPDTGNPYVWGGAGHWSRLPYIPHAILVFWQESMKMDDRKPSADGVDSSWDEIQAALEFIDPSCSRDEWTRVGMALQWTGEQTWNQDQAFKVWDDWSAKSKDKYPGRHAVLQQWRSFKTSKANLVTLGTLFALARQGGWVRPAMDASSLFGSTMIKPEDIIQTMKPAPPDVDLSLWPPALVQRASEVSNSVGCDPLVPLFSGLAAVCGVIDAQTRLELMPGFKVPPVLWLMTIGDPGDLKTPGSRPMLSCLSDIEAGDKQRYAQAKQEWTGKEAAWASAQKAYIEYCGSGAVLLDPAQAPLVPPKPTDPVPLRFTVEDVTSQSLIKIAKDRPRGLLCYLDEMNGWVYKVNNGSTGENRSTWVVAYESARHIVDRAGDGHTHCENFAVSIYGNMQPQILKENFTRLASDGLLQRFLPCVLRHNQTRLGQPIPDMFSSATTWENLLRVVYALTPTTYRLSPDAYKVFRSFQEWYQERLRGERLAHASNEFITAFGKISGLAGRLILLFHAIEDPFSNEVSADIVTRVIRIVREFVIPTYRYVFDGGEGSMSDFDNWVIEYIIQYSDSERITLNVLKHSARRQFDKAQVTQNFAKNEWVIGAMYLLEKMGWVARVDDGLQEGKGVAEWLINPHLKTTFAEYRKAVVQAKVSRDLDRLSKAGLDRPTEVHGAELLDG